MWKGKEMKIFNLIITTKKEQDDLIISCMNKLEAVDRMSTWSAINPVIYDLEELKKNTWDIDRVENIQKWLKINFEVKNEKDC